MEEKIPHSLLILSIAWNSDGHQAWVVRIRATISYKKKKFWRRHKQFSCLHTIQKEGYLKSIQVDITLFTASADYWLKFRSCRGLARWRSRVTKAASCKPGNVLFAGDLRFWEKKEKKVMKPLPENFFLRLGDVYYQKHSFNITGS